MSRILTFARRGSAATTGLVFQAGLGVGLAGLAVGIVLGHVV